MPMLLGGTEMTAITWVSQALLRSITPQSIMCSTQSLHQLTPHWLSPEIFKVLQCYNEGFVGIQDSSLNHKEIVGWVNSTARTNTQDLRPVHYLWEKEHCPPWVLKIQCNEKISCSDSVVIKCMRHHPWYLTDYIPIRKYKAKKT